MARVELTQGRVSRDEVANECEDEMDRLVQFFNEDHELKIVTRHVKDPSAKGNIVQRRKVAVHMEDSKHPFSVLVNEIVEKLVSEGDQVTLAFVRTLVLEIGLRVCFGISNTDADPLEDNTAASLWRWEVRELKLLPRGYREEISERRRRRRKIMERLASLNRAIDLLRTPNQNLCSDLDAVLKAREILAKTDDEASLRACKLDWLLKDKSANVPAQQPELIQNVSLSDSTNVTKDSGKKRRRSDPEEREKLKQEKLLKRQRVDEEKEQKRREKEEAERVKEAEKELKRKEREEAEKKREEKEADKEQRQREKEETERKKQEKEQKRKEKEEAERKKQMAIKKQASFMDRFLQASKKEPKEQSSPESQDSNAQGPSLANEVQGNGHNSTARDSESNDVVSMMDMIFQRNEDYDLDDLKRQYLSRWRQFRHKMSAVRSLGWGTRRKPKAYVVRELRLHGTSSPDDTMKKTSAADSPPKRHRADSEADGFEDGDWKDSPTESWPSTPSSEVKKLASDRYLHLRTKRKKLLQFDKSHRPPYYGTYSKRSAVIKPRNPLKQDPTLDYQVESDEEWEEDEPGESLSDFENDRDEEEERVELEEDDDSADEFMVPDGYLSEGEGVHMEIGTSDTVGCRLSEHSPPAGQSGSDADPSRISPEYLRKVLDKSTEQALRTNRPLIINNLGCDSAANQLSRREILILEALRMRVLIPTSNGVS